MSRRRRTVSTARRGRVDALLEALAHLAEQPGQRLLERAPRRAEPRQDERASARGPREPRPPAEDLLEPEEHALGAPIILWEVVLGEPLVERREALAAIPREAQTERRGLRADGAEVGVAGRRVVEEQAIEQELGPHVGDGARRAAADPSGLEGRGAALVERDEGRRAVEDLVGAVMERDARADARVVGPDQASAAHGREVGEHGAEDEAGVGRGPGRHARVADEVHGSNVAPRRPDRNTDACHDPSRAGIVPRMEDASHLQVYRRFFAITASVLPGLALMLGLGELFLWLFGDVIEMAWGWAIGISSIILAIVFVGWLFVGMMVRTWAETKGTGILLGINAGASLALAVVAIVFLMFVSSAREDRERQEAAERAQHASVVFELPTALSVRAGCV